MSISRTALLAAIALSLVSSVGRADDLAATVAARMKESGALKGYRVNVKAKAGTVWLEGTVADAGQIDTALAAAEAVEGVERVVNRLSVTPQAPASDAFSLPSSIRSLVGLPAPAPVQAAAPAAEQAMLAGGEDVSGGESAAVELTQAVRQDEAAAEAPVARPMAPTKQVGPRPIRAQAAKPVPQPRQSAAGGRIQRTAMKKQYGGQTVIDGQSLQLPGSGEGYVVGEQGGYPQAGGLVDGQMVPGSMRVTEGGAGGYCPPGQAGMGAGGMGGPMPMNGGMGGPGGGMGGGMGGGGMAVPVRGDGPNMPNYAWPSYASYPNYAALQYPTQYSPTAWPYIGPFYPYPQVPLGWRRVSLEWDDGWWWLDFDERHIHSHHR